MKRRAGPAQAAFDWRRPGLVAGVDEAGRGPLAGPVVAAAVILDERRPIAGLADSKVLSPARREALAAEIRAHSLAWALGRAEATEVDELNVLQATFVAMRRALVGTRYRAGARGRGRQSLPGRCRARLRVHRRGRGPG